MSRTPASRPRLLITCEHAGNRVPAAFARHFREHASLLDSHRGWDPGALPLARHLAAQLGAPLRFSLTTRLLVDSNRTAANPELFSEVTRALPDADRRRILRSYHRRHRRRVEETMRPWLARGNVVVHVGVHTFTPVWNGRPREVQVGVLFDPDRSHELRFGRGWIEELRKALPGVVVRANEPYLGTDDGLTTELRARHPADRYLGIELEISQPLATGAPTQVRELRTGLARSLARALSGFSIA